jgi:predicted outer membrane lipoprotein
MELILQIVLGVLLVPAVIAFGILNDMVEEQKKKRNFFDVEKNVYIKKLEFYSTILAVVCLVLLIVILFL